MDQVKDISNGRLSEAIEEAKQARSENRLLREKMTALALSVPPPLPLPPSPPPEES